MKWDPISSGLEDLDDHYDVVVVGSGYGTSVAASRLARAGRRVCVLERGREIAPGDYPDTAKEAREATQVHSTLGRVGDPSSLFTFHMGKDISVLSGCGLGGTSLINANVAIEADRRVFDDVWPKALRDDVDGGLAAGIDRAQRMLGANPLPPGRTPAKLVALTEAGAALGHDVERTEVTVTFADQVNAAGVEQHACTGCDQVRPALHPGRRRAAGMQRRSGERRVRHWRRRSRAARRRRGSGAPRRRVARAARARSRSRSAR